MNLATSDRSWRLAAGGKAPAGLDEYPGTAYLCVGRSLANVRSCR